MISADQIVAHLVGDYLLQSDWMASQKTRRLLVALLHALAYGAAFLFLRPSPAAWAAIVVSHALIDRYRLARYAVWAKNFLGPFNVFGWVMRLRPWSCRHPGEWHNFDPVMLTWRCRCGAVRLIDSEWWSKTARFSVNFPWWQCVSTGYHTDRPDWLAVWLLIIADNTIHLVINGLALRFL